jgi:outer membrane protein W
VGMSFSYETSDWLFRKGVFGLWENFHAVVRAAPDAEDLASQVSTETQDGLRSSYFVTDCLLSK